MTGLKEALLPGNWALQEDQADGGVLLVQVNSQRVFTLHQNTVSVQHFVQILELWIQISVGSVWFRHFTIVPEMSFRVHRE